MPSAAATAFGTFAALIRCSASVQGTWLSSQLPGAVAVKSASAAYGTVSRLISRSSSAKGRPPAR